MSRWQLTRLLAAWEYRRYFKWKGKLIGLGFMALFMVGLGVAGPRLVRRAAQETTVVGVAGAPFALPPALGVEWRPGEAAELRAAYESQELGALLTLHGDSAGTLESRSDGGWVHALQAALDEARRQARLVAHDLDPQVLADITAPFALEHRRTADRDAASGSEGAGRRRPSAWDKAFAGFLLGFMFGGVFTGTALLFTGITSEKQQLVTEQIVAAVPPQTWIDAKILGNGARALEGVTEMVAWSLLGMLIWRDVVDPGFAGLEQLSLRLLLAVAVLAALGFAMWFCFFAAVAATIDDPNTSSRGMFLLLPMVAPLLAIPAWLHPDGGLAVALSLLPPTATVAMSVRLAFTDVPGWQFAVAVAGLLFSVALLRRAAGKVFAMALLLRGKEPGWREIWAAARRG